MSGSPRDLSEDVESPMTQQELIEKQRKQRENIDWFNAEFSRPGQIIQRDKK
jgi:hypothetical protein